MYLPPFDVSHLHETFREVARDVVEAYEDLGESSTDAQTPAILAEAMEQLLEILKRVGHHQATRPTPTGTDETALEGRELSELGDFGIQLLTELSAHAVQLRLDEHAEKLDDLTFPLAVWLARAGAELRILHPVVTAIANLANRTREPASLEALCRVTGEIVEQVSPDLKQDVEKTDSMRPWRILLLNYGIIATRSHQPSLMEHAFDTLIQHLPEEAPEFFRQGMEQMEALDYPDHVREVVQRYQAHWGRPHTIH